MASDWSMLPLDLLGVIAMKLETFQQFIHFSAVCRWWDSASSLIKSEWGGVSPLIKSDWRGPIVPWLLLAENTEENPNCSRKIFNIGNNKCYELNLPETFGTKCWGSAYGWVVLVHRNLRIELFNPINKSQICFPSLESLPNCRLRHEIRNGEKTEEYYINWMLRCYLQRLMVIKVTEGDHDEFVIVILYDYYMQLAFARHDSQSWTSIFTNKTGAVDVVDYFPKVVDVVGINDNVFAFYNDGAIEYWNIKEFQNLKLLKPMSYSPPVGPPVNGDGDGGDCDDDGPPPVFPEGFHSGPYNKIYLVQLGIGLLMVVRYLEEVSNVDHTDYDYNVVYKTYDFRVYKLDSKNKSWEYFEDLGDVALFIGNNFSISVSGAAAKSLQPSCIYFSDDECAFWELPTKLGGHDMGVFNNISGEFSQFYEGDDTRSILCPPTWFIPFF